MVYHEYILQIASGSLVKSMRYLILLAILQPLTLTAQKTPAPSEIARQLKTTMQTRHIEPRVVDDAFSRDVFDAFINELDQQRRYFTQVEIEELYRFRDQLDDQLNGARWDFLAVVVPAYKAKLFRAEKMVTATCALPIDLRFKETYEEDGQYAKDIPNLEDRWRISLVREVLEDLARGCEGQQIRTEAEYLAKNEAVSREKVKRINLRRIQKILNHAEGFENFITTMLFRKYLAAVDPHSGYMSGTQMENFISALSTNGYGLGLEFQENERGDLVVSGLLPGGPAWNSGEINNGDILDKVRWVGKDWIDAAGLTEYELDEIIEESNHDNIEFALRQQGGFTRNVVLRKERVNEEDAVVRAFTLTGSKKIGYISLPDFYSNWGGSESSQSAGDVAKEIVKLKKENIDGLILDVRFNGGGSLAEAVAMTGIFIDGGPVGIQRERGKESLTLKDTNRGTVYDGPLVILVNGLSASASEFLAAALQDYHRAIIVGGRTYGKGIGQELFSLEPGKAKLTTTAADQRWGYASITTTRMYRIGGKSIQAKGVVPDIVLPDLISMFNISESVTPFALKPDSITKKTYAQVLRPLPVDDLRRKSENRVKEKPSFEAVDRYHGALQKYFLTPPGVIEWQRLKHRSDNLHCEYRNLERRLAEGTAAFVAKAPVFSQSRMQLDDYALDVSNGWIEKLSEDHVLEEAFNIICDYIEILDLP